MSARPLPLVAVVSGAACPSAARLRKPELLRRVRVVRVEHEDAAALERQAPLLREAEALLWIPAIGAPSAPAHAVLSRLWPLLPAVRHVHSFTAGVDGIGPFVHGCLAPCANRVTLTNARGAYTSSLAEYALLGMLYFNKQVLRLERNRVARKWDNFKMSTMRSQQVGLLGYGSIGQATGAAAKAAFPGCRVVALRRKAAGSGALGGAGPADEVLCSGDAAQRLRFFRESDFVVSSLPLTDATRGLVGRTELAAMKRSAVLVSLGRGAVIDEQALGEALREGRLRGAVLDVFEKEPLPHESPLWDLDNVLITAHNADNTDDIFELGWKVWLDNLDCFIERRPLLTPVDLAQGY
jgi:phosphoglycerate dehydrogenase-like enzyme